MKLILKKNPSRKKKSRKLRNKNRTRGSEANLDHDLSDCKTQRKKGDRRREERERVRDGDGDAGREQRGGRLKIERYPLSACGDGFY